jgi:hypothetical protein
MPNLSAATEPLSNAKIESIESVRFESLIAAPFDRVVARPLRLPDHETRADQARRRAVGTVAEEELPAAVAALKARARRFAPLPAAPEAGRGDRVFGNESADAPERPDEAQMPDDRAVRVALSRHDQSWGRARALWRFGAGEVSDYFANGPQTCSATTACESYPSGPRTPATTRSPYNGSAMVGLSRPTRTSWWLTRNSTKKVGLKSSWILPLWTPKRT